MGDGPIRLQFTVPAQGAAPPTIEAPTSAITPTDTGKYSLKFNTENQQPVPQMAGPAPTGKPTDIGALLDALPDSVDKQDFADEILLSRALADDLGIAGTFANQAVKMLAKNERQRKGGWDGLRYSEESAKLNQLYFQKFLSMGSLRRLSDIDNDIKTIEGIAKAAGLTGEQLDFTTQLTKLTAEREKASEFETIAEKYRSQLKALDEMYGVEKTPSKIDILKKASELVFTPQLVRKVTGEEAPAMPTFGEAVLRGAKSLVDLPKTLMGTLPGAAPAMVGNIGTSSDILFDISKAAGDRARSQRWGLAAAVPTTGVGAVAGGPVGAAGGFTFGLAAGATAYWTQQIVGEKFREFDEAGVPVGLATVLAGAFGVAESVLESMSELQVGKAAIPGYAQALKNLRGVTFADIQDTMIEEALRAGARTTGGQVVGRAVVGGATAAAQNMAKTIVTESVLEEPSQFVTQNVARLIADRVAGTNLTPEARELRDQLYDTISTTAMTTMAVTGPGSAMQMFQGARQDANAKMVAEYQQMVQEYREAETTAKAEIATKSDEEIRESVKTLEESDEAIALLEVKRTILEGQMATKNVTADLASVDAQIEAQITIRDDIVRNLAGVELKPQETQPITERQEMAKKETSPEARAVFENTQATETSIEEDLRTVNEVADRYPGGLQKPSVAKVEETMAKQEVVEGQRSAKAEAKQQAAMVPGVEAIAAEEEAHPGGEMPLTSAEEKAGFKKETIAAERQRVKNLAAKKKALEWLKDYRAKLVKSISKDTPGDVDVLDRNQIEAMQKEFNKRSVSEARLREVTASREYFGIGPDKKPTKHLDEWVQVKKASKKAIVGTYAKELTISELEAMDTKIQNLITMGKIRRRGDDNVRAKINNAAKESALAAIRKEREIEVSRGGITTGGEKAAAVLRHGKYWTLNPDRFSDVMDGGQLFKGPIHQLMWNEGNDHLAAEKFAMLGLNKALQKQMQEAGLTQWQLSKRFEFKVEGEKKPRIYTKDQILDIYAGWMNEKKRKALKNMGAFAISDELYTEMMKHVTENDEKFVKWVMDAYNEQYKRVREAMIILKNEDPGFYEENYTPIRRLLDYLKPGGKDVDFVDQLRDEAAIRSGIGPTQVQFSGTIARKEIPDKAQSPIHLGLVSTLKIHYPQAEHFAQYAQYMDKLAAVFKDEEVISELRNRFGQEAITYINKYLGDIANPHSSKALKQTDFMGKVFRSSKRNMGLAYLGFKLFTALKQPVSTLHALPYMGAYAFSGLWDMMTNPAETWNFVRENDGTMAGRTFDRFMADLQRTDMTRFQIVKGKLGEAGMKMMWFMDGLAVTAIWKAVYNKNVTKLGHDGAVQEARNVVLRTQGVGDVQHLPPVLRSDNELVQLATVFTSERMQVFQQLTYDMPNMFAKGSAGRGLAVVGCIAMSASIMALMGARRLPRNWQEGVKWGIEEYIEYLPLVGPWITAGMKGWSSKLDIPFIGVMEQLPKTLNTILSGKWGRLDDTLASLAYAIGVAAGFPAEVAKDVTKAVHYIDIGRFDMAAWELLAGGQPKD